MEALGRQSSRRGRRCWRLPKRAESAEQTGPASSIKARRSTSAPWLQMLEVASELAADALDDPEPGRRGERRAGALVSDRAFEQQRRRPGAGGAPPDTREARRRACRWRHFRHEACYGLRDVGRRGTPQEAGLRLLEEREVFSEAVPRRAEHDALGGHAGAEVGGEREARKRRVRDPRKGSRRLARANQSRCPGLRLPKSLRSFKIESHHPPQQTGCPYAVFLPSRLRGRSFGSSFLLLCQRSKTEGPSVDRPGPSSSSAWHSARFRRLLPQARPTRTSSSCSTRRSSPTPFSSLGRRFRASRADPVSQAAVADPASPSPGGRLSGRPLSGRAAMSLVTGRFHATAAIAFPSRRAQLRARPPSHRFSAGRPIKRSRPGGHPRRTATWPEPLQYMNFGAIFFEMMIAVGIIILLFAVASVSWRRGMRPLQDSGQQLREMESGSPDGLTTATTSTTIRRELQRAPLRLIVGCCSWMWTGSSRSTIKGHAVDEGPVFVANYLTEACATGFRLPLGAATSS